MWVRTVVLQKKKIKKNISGLNEYNLLKVIELNHIKGANCFIKIIIISV